MKRIFDIFVSMFLLVGLLPLLILIAIVVWLRMGWPVFFVQSRVGLEGQVFSIFKFRTMRVQQGAAGDEVRLTSTGEWLRRMSLDELPELLNVLRGEMSLVGPRPLLVEYLPLYSDEQMRRHVVRPGLTGWAQVNGRNAISWEEKFRLDVWYVDHQSFMLDMKILALTLGQVLRGSGVNQPGYATAEKFVGTKPE